MPLIHSKSAKAFKKNVETEMETHPGKEHRAQNLAVAYSIKRKARKMAEGGQLTHKNYESSEQPHNVHDEDPNEMASGYVKHESNDVKHNESAFEEDDRYLNQHGEDEIGPEGARMAEGGDGQSALDQLQQSVNEKVLKNPQPQPSPSPKAYAEGGQIHDNYQDDKHEHDMVGRIMKKRQMMYSEGGKVVNTSGMGSKLSQMADDQSDNFDDLSLRDDLEFHYTGKNSGDELGNAREDHDRHDIVSRVMASRRKKDRLPNPR